MLAYLNYWTSTTHHLTIAQTYGHDKISILDEGLPMWIAKGYSTVSGPQQPVSARIFNSNFRSEMYRTLEQMKENYTSKKNRYTYQSLESNVCNTC